MKRSAGRRAEWLVAVVFAAVAVGYLRVTSAYFFGLGVQVAALLSLLVATAAAVLRLGERRAHAPDAGRTPRGSRWAALAVLALAFAVASSMVGVMVPSYQGSATACVHRHGHVVTGDEVTTDGPSPGYYCVSDRGRVLASFR